GLLDGQAFHHPTERAHLTPPFPAAIQCLVPSLFPRRRPPAQAVPIDEDDPTQYPTVIHPRLAMALGKVGQQPRTCSVSLRSLNHTAACQSMGPEPNWRHNM